MEQLIGDYIIHCKQGIKNGGKASEGHVITKKKCQ